MQSRTCLAILPISLVGAQRPWLLAFHETLQCRSDRMDGCPGGATTKTMQVTVARELNARLTFRAAL